MIEAGELKFATKTAAKEHFRAILYRHPLNEPISEPDATELRWLIERHPESRQKVGCGISHFLVRQNPLFPNKGFFVVRIDGTETDFSYPKCIDGPPSPMLEAKQALRAAVREYTEEFKHREFAGRADAAGRIQCATTGQWIAFGEAHVDHAPPWLFEVIAVSFIKARGINVANGFVTPPADNQYEPRVVDPELAQQFWQYHRELADLRIVAAQDNLARSHLSKRKARS
jgi:hypothetical protein